MVDFPYGVGAELKRRVPTRSGEPVAVKLAQDIHSIIEVTEDGDCGVLKPLISASKTRKTAVPSTARASKDKCSCSDELFVLKDTLSSVQADILLLKQTQHAAEKLRAEQMNCVKSVITQVKSDIDMCRIDVEKYMKGSSDTVQTSEDMKTSVKKPNKTKCPPFYTNRPQLVEVKVTLIFIGILVWHRPKKLSKNKRLPISIARQKL